MASSDNSWVFDSLICFLNGPMWNIPMQSFIEEKSWIFEPNIQEGPECKKVHSEFKNLVDLLLGSYMEDICITTEQFEVACNQLVQEKFSSLFEQNIFEQIWAANDYELFKNMMTEKNTELQLQALELHRKKNRRVNFADTVHTDDDTIEALEKTKNLTPSEQEVMVEVLRNYEPIEVPVDIENIMEEEDGEDGEDQESKPIEENKSTESKTETKAYKGLFPERKVEVSEEDMKRRQEYLKMQRDKLVALKKQVRKKHLEKEINNAEVVKNRPKSARTAEKALSGQLDVKPEVLKIRKALAERLRSEVVSNKNS